MKALILLFLIVSCSQTKKENETTNFSDEVTELNIELNTEVDKTKLLTNWLKNNYFNNLVEFVIKPLDINCETSEIYIVSLKDNNISTLKPIYTIVYQKKNKKTFILPFNYQHYFNFNHTSMISGIYTNREFEYLLVFNIEKEIPLLMLDTRNFSGNNIKIGYYKEDECKQYLPMQFKAIYCDSSIIFDGKILNFCKNNNDDRNEELKKPINTEKVKLIYTFTNNTWSLDKNSQYVYW